MTRLTDETLVKTNKYQYLSVVEVKDVHVESSEARLQRIGSGDVRSEEDVRRWLGDEEGEHSLVRRYFAAHGLRIARTHLQT